MHWSVYAALIVFGLFLLLVLIGMISSNTYQAWAEKSIPRDNVWRDSVMLYRRLRLDHPEADLGPFRGALEELEKKGVLESRVRRPDGVPITDTFGEWRRKSALRVVDNVA